MSTNKFSFFKPSDNTLPETKTNTNSVVSSKPSTESNSADKSIFDSEATPNKFNFFGNQSNNSLSSQTSIFSSSNTSNLFSNGSIWSVNTKTDFKRQLTLPLKYQGLVQEKLLVLTRFRNRQNSNFRVSTLYHMPKKYFLISKKKTN